MPQQRTRPSWYRKLKKAVRSCLEGEQKDKFHWKCIYRRERDTYDFLIYPAPFEVLGGDQDGKKMWQSFSVDIDRLSRLFDKNPKQPVSRWHSTGCAEMFSEEYTPANLRFGGWYHGKNIMLCIAEDPPPEIEPRYTFNLETQELTRKA